MKTIAPMASISLSLLRKANEATVLHSFSVDLSIPNADPIADGPFKGLPATIGEGISFRGPGGTEVRAYPTRLEIRAVESSKSLFEDEENAEDVVKSFGQRVTTVHTVIFGKVLVPDLKNNSGSTKMVVSEEEQELETIRTGLSFNNNSANANLRSVSLNRQNANLFLAPRDNKASGDGQNSSPTNEVSKRVLNAFSSIERAVRDSFEGIDLSRFEEGGDLYQLSEDDKKIFRDYYEAVRNVGLHLKNWKKPSTNSAKPSVTNDTAQAKIEKSEPTTIEELEAQVS